MAKKSRNNQKANPTQALWGGMWRTIGMVLVAAMNKGLFVPSCIFFLLLVMLLKTPPEFIPTLWNALADYKQWGYILAAAAVTAWAMNVRYLRRIHHTEMKRISDEKKQLQEELAGRPMKSSGGTA